MTSRYYLTVTPVHNFSQSNQKHRRTSQVWASRTIGRQRVHNTLAISWREPQNCRTGFIAMTNECRDAQHGPDPVIQVPCVMPTTLQGY